MKKEYQAINGYYVTRRTKTRARKDYEEGYTVSIVPCNMSFRSMWHNPYTINKDSYACTGKTFDKICNDIAYYNCNNEAGRYLKYYTMADSERKGTV